MREFYFRPDNDPAFRDDILEVTNEVEALLYQVRLVMNTRPGDVLGSDKFGVDMDGLLFSFDFDNNKLNSILVDQTNTYCEMARKYKLRYQARRLQDEKNRDIGLIDISVNGKSVMGFLY
jgi:hypothetical protein